MDIIDNRINKRIQDGFLPAEKLFYPDLIDNIKKTDLAVAGNQGLMFYTENPDAFQFCFNNMYANMLSEPASYVGTINTYLNTGFAFDSFLPSAKEACFLVPVVTELDQILWCAASFLEATEITAKDYQKKSIKNLKFAWIYLLSIVQKKEVKTGLTISVKAACKKRDLLGVILGDWKRGLGKNLKKLSENEIYGFTLLESKREELNNRINDEIHNIENIERETHDDWVVFLKIVNDISSHQSQVISDICSTCSAKEKLKTINEYQYKVNLIAKDQYEINGETIDLLRIKDSIRRRYDNSTYYSRAIIQNGEAFIVHAAIYDLVFKQHSFNYLFICYHHLRLSPKKETVYRFFSVALECIRKNLGQNNDKRLTAIYDMIVEFHSTVVRFLDDNRSIIEELHFSKLQNDAVSINMSHNYRLEKEYEWFQTELEKEVTTAFSDEKTLKKALKKKTPNKKDVENSIQKVEESWLQIDREASARQIIISLNIIYLFCDALRIILLNRHAHINLRDPEKVDRYRIELRQIDHYLIEKVYSAISYPEIGMLEYREKIGLDSSVLTAQEQMEEYNRNNGFAEILRNAIEKLVSGIEERNVEQILKIKADIRDEIFDYPACDEKDQFAPWLDGISERICNALIGVLRSEEIGFNENMSAIRNGLGDESKRLPVSTINALTTAEMLYNRYTIDEYANEGFDYSCISALYYQAFENAYNELIWGKYAKKLNSLCIHDQAYTDILEDCQSRGIKIHEAKGYLDPDPNKRKHYINYRNTENHTTSVKQTCMYGNFAILMRNVNEDSKLDKFCDFFADIAGFSDKAEMFADKEFMEECNIFTKKIESSTKNRNNASHGGAAIEKEQCQEDKRTIIEELSLVRKNSFGLIQQLLYIIQ